MVLIMIARCTSTTTIRNFEKTMYSGRHLGFHPLIEPTVRAKGPTPVPEDRASIRVSMPARRRARHQELGKEQPPTKRCAITPFSFSRRSKLFNVKFQHAWQPAISFQHALIPQSHGIRKRNLGSLKTAAPGPLLGGPEVFQRLQHVILADH